MPLPTTERGTVVFIGRMPTGMPLGATIVTGITTITIGDGGPPEPSSEQPRSS